ncbi:molybdate transport system ATP-binding protein [Aliiruegeria haliotis]|uniref:Molybdate transport system ATP-binding protein n=1 Tax=Aliiruegeria haliotis TaxID=1280846 RepID=A0A2T0RFA9_9RHOB|nr:molybdenum ABC transporter ATP-binding protein [Aliiruegeria haliotis]PRY19858.1 molybdate transport system ATP-binding protein [Aliiruegeria haliotis]
MTLSIRLRHAQSEFELDVDFTTPPGVTALFGHSGAGKTTIVQAVAGLLKPDSGRISIDDALLEDSDRGFWTPPRNRRVGYVFQDGRLFPHMTVLKNLRYGANLAGVRDPAEEDRVVDLLGLSDYLHRYPGTLSGGEKQRVAIGRALLSRPRLLLLDEPLAALDPARREEILPHLERLRDNSGLPILYVSHAPSEVARLATTVVLLERGKVLKLGPASEILSDPQMVPAIGPREAGAILAATVIRHHDDGLSELQTSAGTLLLPAVSAAPGRSLRVRIAAHDVILSREAPKGLSALNILPARVCALRLGDGPGAIVQVETGTDRLLARITRRSVVALGLEPGADCYAIIKSVAVAREDIGRG